jgi:NAD(P)-dependent dehydrogenase (short-subunit alcohol dehydrogenase family)
VAESNGSARVALVTGAAKGIGRGIALRLAADGLDVAVNDIEESEGELDEVAEEIRQEGQRAQCSTCGGHYLGGSTSEHGYFSFLCVPRITTRTYKRPSELRLQ